MGLFERCFGEVADPRADNARHELVEAVFIAVAAAVYDAQSCVDMAEFGLAKEPLFRLLGPAAFHAALQRFIAEFAQAVAADEVIALDAKAARRSFDRARTASPLHLAGAWACGARPTGGSAAGCFAVGSPRRDGLGTARRGGQRQRD